MAWWSTNLIGNSFLLKHITPPFWIRWCVVTYAQIYTTTTCKGTTWQRQHLIRLGGNLFSSWDPLQAQQQQEWASHPHQMGAPFSPGVVFLQKKHLLPSVWLIKIPTTPTKPAVLANNVAVMPKSPPANSCHRNPCVKTSWKKQKVFQSTLNPLKTNTCSKDWWRMVGR